MLRTLGQSIISVLVVLFAALGSQTSAAASGVTWKEPQRITVGAQQYVDYRTLQGTGDAVYYSLTIDQPTRIRFEVSISRSAATKFVPQVVVFEPYTSTFGPILPVEQPPNTIAVVYPATQPRPVFDAFSQTLSTVRLEAQPLFASAGTYTFAIYNAGSGRGEFKFTLDRGASVAEWQDAWMMLGRWWQDQTFAGFSWLTLITPILLGLLLWLVYKQLDHHRLHVHKSYKPRPPKKLKS